MESLIYGPVGLLWAAAVVRLARGRRRRHAGSLHAITVALFAIAFAGTVDIPDISSFIDRATSWTNTGPALKSVCIVVAAAANQVMLLHLVRGRSVRRRGVTVRWLIAAVVSALSLALFAMAGRLPVDDMFTRNLGLHPWAATSRLLVEFYAAYVLTLVALLCRRELTRSPLGRGLALLGAGTATLVVHAALRVMYIGGNLLHLGVPEGLYSLGSAVAALGLALVAIGTMVTPAEHFVRAHLELRNLGPLWRDTTRIAPRSTANNAVPSGAAASVDHRVVQVQDALYLAAVDRGSSGVGIGDVLPPARAACISRWIHDESDHSVTTTDLVAPPGLSDRAWIHMIASQHRHQVDNQWEQAS